MAAELVSLPRLRDGADLMQWSRELIDTLQRVFSGQVTGISIDIHALKAGATTWDLQEVQQNATVPLPNNVPTLVATTIVDLTSLTLGEQSGVVMFGFTDVTTYVNTPNGPIITSSLYIDGVEFSRQQQVFGQFSRYTLSQGGMKFLNPGLHTLDFKINADWNGNSGAIQANLSKVMFVALR